MQWLRLLPCISVDGVPFLVKVAVVFSVLCVPVEQCTYMRVNTLNVICLLNLFWLPLYSREAKRFKIIGVAAR